MLAPLGYQGGYLIQLGSAVRYDTRGDYLNTTRGRLDEIGIEWGIGEGGDYNGGELAVEHRHFKSLTERLIFAQRFLGTYSFGDVPFYEQPKLGAAKRCEACRQTAIGTMRGSWSTRSCDGWA